MSINVKVAVMGPPVVDNMVAHVRVIMSRQSGSSFVDLVSDGEAGEQTFELGPDDKLEVLPRGLVPVVRSAEPRSSAGETTSVRRAAVAAAASKKEAS